MSVNRISGEIFILYYFLFLKSLIFHTVRTRVFYETSFQGRVAMVGRGVVGYAPFPSLPPLASTYLFYFLIIIINFSLFFFYYLGLNSYSY